MNVTRAQIIRLQGSWGSGLATLYTTAGAVSGDNGPLVRALKAVGEGHTINQDAIKGRDIVYWLDDFGLTIGGLTDYESWIDNGLPEIGLNETVEVIID